MTAPGPNRSLRVGVNLLWMGERAGGAGRAGRGLVEGLVLADPGAEVHLFLARDSPEDLAAEPWWTSVRRHRLPVACGGLPTLAAQHAALPALAARHGLDVLHSPANTGPVAGPGGVKVVTLLDLIWWHFPDQWEGDRRAQRAMRRQTLYAVRRADMVLAISHAAARDIARTLRLDPDRLAVTPLGVTDRQPARATDEATLRERLGLGTDNVILCVAQKRRYKNLGALIRALTDVRGVLVLPGAPTPHECELRELARRAGVAERVRFVDWVDEDDLEGLYRLATCFVLPSLIEGFGLPVLEAMRRGVPVACSDAGSLPEVAGDAALLFDPHRPQEIAAAIRRIQESPTLRDSLVERGRRRAASQSWRATGEATLAAYRRAIGPAP